MTSKPRYPFEDLATSDSFVVKLPKQLRECHKALWRVRKAAQSFMHQYKDTKFTTTTKKTKLVVTRVK